MVNTFKKRNLMKGYETTNMIIDLSAPLFCILLGVGSGIGWLLWRKQNWQIRYWLIPMFLCYILLVIKLTLFPVYIFDQKSLDGMKENLINYMVYYQPVPFASIQTYFHGSGPIQLVGNIVLLAPLAVFAEIFSQQRPKAWKTALVVSSGSLLIEILQLAVNLATQYPARVTDIDDLILNAFGVVLALIVTRTLCKNQKLQKLSRKLLYR